MLEVLMLKVSQMNDTESWFTEHWTHYDFFQTNFMDYYDTFETFAKRLDLQVASPFTFSLHCFNIFVERAVFVFI
jgi:hypothetical protein